ncbi:MAG TPA: hypothetical protein VN654_16325 [Vicinamibacterales bacterium]|jgi:hypothetical protein|nr:hypothetical protein [Vicinamibacterales bacterium]
MLRVLVVPFLVMVGLIVIAVLLPSKRDTSVAAWWARVSVQMMFFARALLAVAGVVAVVWFVLLPMLGWR